jgi:hypothetical protein
MSRGKRLKAVFIISDGIRGHVNQSRGVVHFLSELTGCQVYELEINEVLGNFAVGIFGQEKLLAKIRRFYLYKILGRRLAAKDEDYICRWLARTGGLSLLERAKRLLVASGASRENVLFLSAGSVASLYSFALAKVLQCRCATIMTPSALGTKPFDFAIVPKHDCPKSTRNVYVTLGAPNMVTPEKVRGEAEDLSKLYPPGLPKRIGLLLGGSDGNYTLSSQWVRQTLKPMFEMASACGMDVYITTSRRTPQDVEEMLKSMRDQYPCIRYLCIASKDSYNPVYGIFGLATHVLATEDSVSMISEAATAGFRVGILPVGRRKSPKRALEGFCKFLVSAKILSPKRLFGVPKFESALDELCSLGLARWIRSANELSAFLNDDKGRHGLDFCEAKEAACWIVRNFCKETLKVIQILPEFHEGGVERHVLWLSNAMAKAGHEVLVVTKGGKLEKFLDEGVKVWHLPVHAKNPFTALWCALRIAKKAKGEGWDVIHAHSRVPFWIAWWAGFLSGIPWVATLHATFRHSRALVPLKKACACIAVSQAVKDHLAPYLPDKTFVVYNGLLPTGLKWQGSLKDNPFKFLFVGRLSPKKGLQVALKALSDVRGEWILDVVGDGPMRAELELLSRKLNLDDKVCFWGFRDDADEWLARCSCFLFPSLEEGMGMTLMRAMQMGVPVLASDLPPVRELCLNPETLLTPGDEESWRKGIEDMLRERKAFQFFDRDNILTVEDMMRKVFEVYKWSLDWKEI